MLNLHDSLNKSYFDMTVYAIRQLNENAGTGVSYNSVMYLDIISYQENCTISSLAEILHISKSAVTMKVNELVHMGLVIKTRSEKDRRVHYLRISDEVESTLQAYDRPFERAVRMIEAEYSPEQIQTFCGILLTLCREYEKEDL